MGFSSPKAVKQEPAPPPVTTSSADAASAAKQERMNQRARNGYMSTIAPTPKKSLLSAASTMSPAPITPQPVRKSLLSAS